MSKKKMKTAELFSGTKSFSKVMKTHGHSIYTIDSDRQFEPDFRANVIELFDEHFIRIPGFRPDILWASPPCTAFSVSSMKHHWTGGFRAYKPATEKAKLSQRLVKKTIKIIDANNPKWWFIENPRGMLRKMSFMEKLEERPGVVRRTVSYCQYGEDRMKPTDIWTNAVWWNPKPICKNGDPCHVRAPRGARTGTQGMRNARDRGVIPPLLFEEILEQVP